MASQTKITITHDKEATGDLVARLITSQFSSKAQLNSLENILNRVASGAANGIVQTVIDDGNAVTATGTLTLSSVVATNTCVVNGTTFTAVASGATGAQFNVGGSDTITATNLAAAINATAAFSGMLIASSAAAVVTIASAASGTIGNAITLAGGTNITAGGLSGGRLSGGSVATNPSSVSYATGL